MNRPISPAVRFRLAAHFKKQGNSDVEAVEKATQAIRFIEAAGLDVVMPGWIPVIDEEVLVRKRAFSWDDLPKMVKELEDRAPWKPYGT